MPVPVDRVVDILTAFMALANVDPLITLSGKVAKVIDDCEAQKKNNIEDPVRDFSQEM